MISVIFFGTPEFSVPFLQALTQDPGITVAAVVTAPDKPYGRGQIITPSPVKKFALENSLTVFTPSSLKTKERWLVKHLPVADMFIVVAYGKIIPQTILDLPKLGTVNVHPSLLPKYRGASPLQSAILNREKQTGISIMLLDAQMDHGPLLSQKTIKLAALETPFTLRQKIVKIGAPLLIDVIKKYAGGKIKPRAQNHDLSTFCNLLNRQDGIINWKESAETIEAKIRGLTPWPGAATDWRGKTLKIHEARISSPTNVNNQSYL